MDPHWERCGFVGVEAHHGLLHTHGEMDASFRRATRKDIAGLAQDGDELEFVQP